LIKEKTMPFNHPDYAGVRAAVKQDMHPVPAQHPDTVAVNRFAEEMATKMAQARAKGRDGWETCPPDVLSRMLREHVEKGDPRDVANFCMMLWHLGQPIAPAPAPAAVAVPDERAAYIHWLTSDHPTVYDEQDATHWWLHGHVSALAWQARAALAATPPAQAQSVELEALRDMLDTARIDLDMLREALCVPVEPHQSLSERMLEAAQAQDVQRDADIQRAVLAERERICAAIKAEDDHCVTQGDYMLDSEDCIKVVRGEWVRPVYEIGSAAQEGGV
jgi:hypothetical protein